MRILKNPANIYAFLWCLYYVQGVLYTEGGIISKGVLVLLGLLSAYYTIRVLLLKDVPRLIKGIMPLFFLMVFYAIIRLFSSESIVVQGTVIPPFNAIKTIVLSITPLFAFYYFSKRGLISEQWFRYWFFIFFVVVCASFFKNQSSFLEEHSDKTELTNNNGYLFLALFPIIVFFRKLPVFMWRIRTKLTPLFRT